MLDTFHTFAVLSILLVTFVGGYLPLFRQDRATTTRGFAAGEAFTAGVFLALALLLMGPSAVHLTHAAWPDLEFPVSGALAIAAFGFLLGLEQVTSRADDEDENALTAASIPIIMTTMIAIPSFFLGTALGISDGTPAMLVLVAILIHKSSAAFALALKMVRSTLSRNQARLLFALFAFSTPVGVLFGDDVHSRVGAATMTQIKAVILAVASGVFLFMSTLHELQRAPMIRACGTWRGFALMLAGIGVTAVVRILIGEAHRI